MRGFEYFYDKLLLAVGVLLLVLLWVQFPAMPEMYAQDHIRYTSEESAVVLNSKARFLKPSKALSPRQVIMIQLHALQRNDMTDSGIITVFNFSSPSSRVSLGPLNNFRMKVRDPAYSPMLNFVSYKTGQMVITGDTAYQLVVIKGVNGEQVPYLFILSKQRRGIYKGCWMTVGVARRDTSHQTSLI
jgi:predicted nucleic acid-binding protein